MALWGRLQSFFDPFETRVVYFTLLVGVPYLILGILCFALQQFGFEFARAGAYWAAIITIGFFSGFAFLTAYILHLCAPNPIRKRRD